MKSDVARFWPTHMKNPHDFQREVAKNFNTLLTVSAGPDYIVDFACIFSRPQALGHVHVIATIAPKKALASA